MTTENREAEATTGASTTYYLGDRSTPVTREVVVQHFEETLQALIPDLVVHTRHGSVEYYRRLQNEEHALVNEFVEAVTINESGDLLVWVYVLNDRRTSSSVHKRDGTYLWQVFAAGAWEHVTHANIALKPDEKWMDKRLTDTPTSLWAEELPPPTR